MALLINQTFFKRELEIPNLTNESVSEKLGLYITKYEPICLLKTLGYPLFKIFGTENSQRMSDLLEGSEFNDGLGELRRWQGIVHDEDISFIANYIYFYYQQDMAKRTVGTGTTVKKQDSGISVSPADKMTTAWNFFSSEVYDMTHFLWMKKVDGERVYPEFTYHQYLETRRISRFIDAHFSF